jgi:LytR cell envelope-related transcriptional attenuator
MPQVTKNTFKTGKTTAMPGFTSRSLTVLIAFAFLLVVAIGFAVYFFLQYQSSEFQLKQSSQANEQKQLIEEVGKLIILPKDEQPNIATVSDIGKLKNQPFFANARDGDKVLIYTKAKEAILYDPFVNRIVQVGPISLTQASSTPVSVPTPAPVRVAVYNGTTIVGYAASVSAQLEKKLPNVTVVLKTDAQKSSYTKTIVVDLTGKNATQAASLAKELDGKVSALPHGEIKPVNTDLLVILGK